MITGRSIQSHWCGCCGLMRPNSARLAFRIDEVDQVRFAREVRVHRAEHRELRLLQREAALARIVATSLEDLELVVGGARAARRGQDVHREIEELELRAAADRERRRSVRSRDRGGSDAAARRVACGPRVVASGAHFALQFLHGTAQLLVLARERVELFLHPRRDVAGAGRRRRERRCAQRQTESHPSHASHGVPLCGGSPQRSPGAHRRARTHT
ncbi:MAG: hypothetical protein MUF70_15570 [Myxococcota bacterium]|nr:hypothetical protein [Myxococcota bacterium]